MDANWTKQLFLNLPVQHCTWSSLKHEWYLSAILNLRAAILHRKEIIFHHHLFLKYISVCCTCGFCLLSDHTEVLCMGITLVPDNHLPLESPFWINYTRLNTQNIAWQAIYLDSAYPKYPGWLACQLFTRNAYNINICWNPDLSIHGSYASDMHLNTFRRDRHK